MLQSRRFSLYKKYIFMKREKKANRKLLPHSTENFQKKKTATICKVKVILIVYGKSIIANKTLKT